MTQKTLINKARKVAKSIVAAPEAGITLEMLPKVRVEQAVVVYFEGDRHNGKIDVILEKRSGKFVAAGFVRPKATKSTSGVPEVRR